MLREQSQKSQITDPAFEERHNVTAGTPLGMFLRPEFKDTSVTVDADAYMGSKEQITTERRHL